MSETAVTVEGPVGVLQGLYQETPNARGVMLLCHPNPERGGSMQNKVVTTLQRSARDAGYATLRFNYRGTGESAGTHAMGMGEVDDAEAAALWLKAKYPGLALSLAGFSFGGFVAAALAGRLEASGEVVDRLVLVAPALWWLPAEAPLARQAKLLLVQPENDEVVSPQSVYAWSAAHQDCPHDLLKVAECGHFFHGKLIELRDLLKPYL